MNNLEKLKEDIKNTIRIKNLNIREISEEKTIKGNPDLAQNIENLNIKIYVFK